MSDGTIDETGDVVAELRATAEESHGGTETESPTDVDRTIPNGVDGRSEADRSSAGDFAAVSEGADDDGVVGDQLDGETPAEIVARADEPDPEPDSSIDLLPEAGELDVVLLPDRKREDDFLWIEAGPRSTPQVGDDSDPKNENRGTAEAGAEGCTTRSTGDPGPTCASDPATDSDPDGDSDSTDENGVDGSGLLDRVRSWLPG